MDEEEDPNVLLARLRSNPPRDGSRRGVADRTFYKRQVAWQRAVERAEQKVREAAEKKSAEGA